MFSGIGLLDYGLHLAGLEHSWLCEREADRRGILAQRWPGARVLDDVRVVGHDTCERVDLIAGGFPCKGASTAGRRNGFDHPETVLWHEMARAVDELRPRYVLVENVAHILALRSGAVWGTVLGDLAALGYDTVWDCLPAAAVGAPHLRDRVLAVATHRDGASPDPHAEAGASRSPVGERARLALTDSHSLARRHEQEPEPRSSGTSAARGGDPPAPDAGGIGRPSEGWGRSMESEERTARPHAASGGVAVEWGRYALAVRRWEAVQGPAPEPLVRRVDDRSAARVERSRLSALGDGVQCQVGQLAGAYIVEQERLRCLSEAA